MSSLSVSGFVVSAGSSKRRNATLRLDENCLVWLDGELEPCGSLSQLQLPNRVGNTARFFQLPDGRGFETQDNDGLDALIASAAGSRGSLAHRLEENLSLVAIAVVLLIGAVAMTVTKGVPWAADTAASLVPDELRTTLGQTALQQIDERWFVESALSAADRQRLDDLFLDLSSEVTASTRLVFRSSKQLGANALAFPDGTVVLTDQLVQLSDNDEQIAAVLLHELAHVEYDHGLRSVLRQAGLSTLVLVFTGDVSTSSSLIIMLPTVMLSLEYSREFEAEADRFALDRMLSRSLDPRAFAQIMRKLEYAGVDESSDAQSDGEQDQNYGIVNSLDYFSSHPATEERIRMFEDAARECGPRPQDNAIPPQASCEEVDVRPDS